MVDEQEIIFDNLLRLANSDNYCEDKLLALQLMVGVGVPEGLSVLHLLIPNTDKEDVFDEIVSIVGLFMQTDLPDLQIYLEESSSFPSRYNYYNKRCKDILKKSLVKAQKLVIGNFPNLKTHFLLDNGSLFFTKRKQNYIVPR